MEAGLISKTAGLLALLERKGLKLSAAESCTGGLLCHALTSVTGASKVFHSGIVAYSDDSKIKLLGVAPEVIAQYGAVSAETASAMAEAIFLKSGADISVGITGNIEPDASEAKAPVIVFIAVRDRNGIESASLGLSGNRIENKYKAADSALDLLLKRASGL
ncbi:MAG: CinA family protein [Nitrospirae bacterium]|nr:MAG: CinA family protein [Nitrospirota bacterium]